MNFASHNLNFFGMSGTSFLLFNTFIIWYHKIRLSCFDFQFHTFWGTFSCSFILLSHSVVLSKKRLDALSASHEDRRDSWHFCSWSFGSLCVQYNTKFCDTLQGRNFIFSWSFKLKIVDQNIFFLYWPYIFSKFLLNIIARTHTQAHANTLKWKINGILIIIVVILDKKNSVFTFLRMKLILLPNYPLKFYNIKYGVYMMSDKKSLLEIVKNFLIH